MIKRIADAVDRFLFGTTEEITTVQQRPVSGVRFVPFPSSKLGIVTNDFSPTKEKE